MNGGDSHTGYTEVEDDEDLTSNGSGSNGHDQAQSSDPAWPTLAQAAYHGLAGEVVARLLPNTESDPAALLLQYLTSFGNAVGRQPYYLVERTRHFCNLFVVLIGSTAKARKGTAADARRLSRCVGKRRRSLYRSDRDQPGSPAPRRRRSAAASRTH